MLKLVSAVSIAVLGLLFFAPVSGADHTSASSLTHYLHYESVSSDCTGDFYLDVEDYPDPGHSCAAIEQQLEPTEWVPETFTPVELDTSRRAMAQLAVTGVAFDSAAVKVRLYGVRSDGQRILVGRSASSEFSSELPNPQPAPKIPDLQPQTHHMTMVFTIRQVAKKATFTTIALETDLVGFAPGAYIQLDKPASSFTIPTTQSTAAGCSVPCATPSAPPA